MLGGEDIGDQHRRTVLGPVWILVSYGLYVGAFIAIFGREAAEGFPLYIATGMMVWLVIQEMIIQSASLFIREESFIKGTRLPLTVYILKLSFQTLVRSGYVAIGWLAIVLTVGLPGPMAWVEFVTGVLLVMVIVPPTITVLAILGALLPDLQFILQNVMRVGLFLTPIFWLPHGDSIRTAVYRWNPFTYMIEVVRTPILTAEWPMTAILVCFLIFAVMSVAALVLLAKYRNRIVFAL